MVAILLLVVGGFNWGFVALTGKDAVSALFGKNTLVTNAIFIAVAIAALAIGMYRDSYLPFLGPSVMPCSLLKAQTPEGADTNVQVLVKPGAKVLYWAAEPGNKDLEDVKNWREAYLGFKNAGVVMADENGFATLSVRKPQNYSVGMKGVLPQHVHYRICMENGFIGRVETVKLDGKELFTNYVAEQEDYATVSEDNTFRYVNPATAVEEINGVTEKTLRESLMVQSGAPDEAPGVHAAALSDAFGPSK